MDPRTRLLLLLLAGVLAVVLEHAASLALLTLLCFVPLLLAPIGNTWRVRALTLAAAAIWTTVLSQALFYAEVPRRPLLDLGPVVLWREGVTHGLVQSLRLLSIATAGLAVVATTPLDRLLAALVALRVPFTLSFLAVTGLRFVPEVGREILVVRRARARRGRPVWQRSPARWLALEVSLLRPVVARAVRRARTMAESLDARGFDAHAPRAVRRPLQMRSWEPVLLGSAAAVTLAAVAARLLYAAYVAEVAYFPSLRPLYGFVRSWL
ncbi:MAG: hypothetical protein GY898_10990 [Proteobacteria bacterium]|nr:hypothetical protein [Pseudomonadota bacterium]